MKLFKSSWLHGTTQENQRKVKITTTISLKPFSKIWLYNNTCYDDRHDRSTKVRKKALREDYEWISGATMDRFSQLNNNENEFYILHKSFYKNKLMVVYV